MNYPDDSNIDPMIYRWAFCLEKADPNHLTTEKALQDFLENIRAVDDIRIDGKCRLRGLRSDDGGYSDDEMITDYINSIEKVSSSTHSVGTLPYTLLCATTVSGDKYYIYDDGSDGKPISILI